MKTIDHLQLSAKCTNALWHRPLQYIEDLKKYIANGMSLRDIKGIGEKGEKEILEKLSQYHD